MAAPISKLNAIHAALATTFLNALEDGVRVVNIDKEGNEAEHYRPLTAAELSVIVAFLKNNNVTSSVEDNDELAALAAKLRGEAKTKKITPILDDDGETTWQ